MKNINNAGPNDERQRKVNELMNKLRARGQVGDSSEMGTAEQFLSKKPAPVEPAAAEKDEDKREEAVVAEEVGRAAVEAGAVREDKESQTTSGIGGSWTGAAAGQAREEKHAPKVSTWGVFERPADISKAYGGGRRVGVGGYQPSEEEVARKRAETEAKLAQFRKGQGAEKEVQDATLTLTLTPTLGQGAEKEVQDAHTEEVPLAPMYSVHASVPSHV